MESTGCLRGCLQRACLNRLYRGGRPFQVNNCRAVLFTRQSFPGGTIICFPDLGGGLVAKSCPTLAIPWTVAFQAPMSVGFSRQEYWSGLPFPSPGDFFPIQGLNPDLPHYRQTLYRLSHQGSPTVCLVHMISTFPHFALIHE